MNINIVCGKNSIIEFSKSNFYKKDLGFASSIDDVKSGERIFSTKDNFAVLYNIKYKTTIYKKGKVGNYAFYMDSYILDDSIATYCDELEFIMKFDYTKVKNDGINSYIGFIIRTIIEQKTKNDTESVESEKTIKLEPTVISGTSKILTTPGSVRYEDVQEYLRNRNKI